MSRPKLNVISLKHLRSKMYLVRYNGFKYGKLQIVTNVFKFKFIHLCSYVVYLKKKKKNPPHFFCLYFPSTHIITTTTKQIYQQLYRTTNSFYYILLPE